MPEINKELQTAKRRSPRAGILLATAALLILMPCLGLVSGGAYLWARQTGTFSRWHSLGAPPGGGAEIVTGDVDVVYVLTLGGALYGCEHGEKRAAEDCWEPAHEPLSVDPKATSDHKLFSKEVRPPPGTVADTLDVTVWYAEDAFETRYVLMQDGTVWKWQYDVGGYLSLFVLILGPAAGLGLGILAAVVLWVQAGFRSSRHT